MNMKYVNHIHSININNNEIFLNFVIIRRGYTYLKILIKSFLTYLVNNINKNIIKELKLIELMINSLIILIKFLNV